jgi:(2R)-ethylmalonyl-CoA mutase
MLHCNKNGVTLPPRSSLQKTARSMQRNEKTKLSAAAGKSRREPVGVGTAVAGSAAPGTGHVPADGKPMRDKPWIFRTYAGHSTAAASNALYRTNLSKGQTGLSVAFDLPTQTGYDSDHPLAKGEVGKVGVPICHLGDMRALFEAIPLGAMNTSMTINATAAWLLALYIALADEQRVPRLSLQGTTQNDIIKEYLSRGTYVFPPSPSMRLTKDVILFTTKEMPKWNPINVCSYHLQEAGATPVQEVAFALATAVGVLDAVKAQCAEQDFGEVVGRISFFVNAGLRFVTEICKMRAFTELWDEITRSRYGVCDPKQRLFRYGVQVNSLGLTEQQPENNVARILLEMLAVTLSKDARARAVQLPAWNEALGLPRPWDQQWSLRMQQILAYETDLLEYGDIFNGSPVIAAKVAELKAAARDELDHIEALGGTVAAVESGYLKQQLVESNSRRVEAIERGEQTVVGANRFTESEPSPLAAAAGAVLMVSAQAEADQIARLNAWREERDASAVAAALDDLRQAAKSGANIMPSSIACAKAGVTTGEWGAALRAAFGEYRAPTGVGTAMRNDAEGLDEIRAEVDRLSKKLGRRMKLLVGKPGLDGHSNGAEQIAARARDAGMEVVYDGIRLTAESIAAAAREKKVHVVGLSILSGSHLPLVHEVIARLKDNDAADLPVVVGGIIPPQDVRALKQAGVAEVYTPKDFALNRIMADLVRIVEGAADRGE